MSKWEKDIWVSWLRPGDISLEDYKLLADALGSCQPSFRNIMEDIFPVTKLPAGANPEYLLDLDKPNKNDDTFSGKGIRFTHSDYIFDHMNRKQTKQKTIVIVSGYYAPIHTNHIEMMEAARALGDELYVIVNNDKQLVRKKGFCFQDEKERLKIVSSLRFVDHCMLSVDNDDSVAMSLAKIAGYPYGCSLNNLIFANGGDRDTPNPTEDSICKQFGIRTVYSVGPPKTTSSSDLIQRVISHYLYKGTK